MSVSRRQFILGSAAGLVTLNHSTTNASIRDSHLPKGAHVVVVGAGFAGIGAAELLIGEGYKVTHIEARDRIGGRAHTIDVGGFPAELGANWLRPNNNALQPFARKNGLLSHKSNLVDAVTAEARQISEIDLKQAYALLESPLAATYIWYHTRKYFGFRPRADSVQSLIGDAIDAGAQHGCAVETLLRVNYAADLDQLSGTVLLDEGSVSDDLNEPTIKGGMQALASALVKHSRPSFYESVTSVSRTSDGVDVMTDKRKISADAVIVTVPISVLKSGKIAFEPNLPSKLKSVLDAMEMGNLLKVWIRFPETSWTFKHTVASFCKDSLFSVAFNFDKSHNTPILLGMAAGRDAHRLEELSDQEIANLFVADLNEHLGFQLSDPAQIAVSRWGQDPLALGAYMYPNVNYRAGDNRILREPIADRILLAGEALADSYGYVDTAWEDGRRAAKLLIGS